MKHGKARPRSTTTKLVAAIGAATLTAVSGPAIAGGESGLAKVVQMATASNFGNYVFIRVSTTPTTPATCALHPTWHFILDTSTPWGKTAYTMLVEARATGRDVWLSGTNACYSDVELLRGITTYE
jgi:hypothetical protein